MLRASAPAVPGPDVNIDGGPWASFGLLDARAVNARQQKAILPPAVGYMSPVVAIWPHPGQGSLHPENLCSSWVRDNFPQSCSKRTLQRNHPVSSMQMDRHGDPGSHRATMPKRTRHPPGNSIPNHMPQPVASLHCLLLLASDPCSPSPSAPVGSHSTRIF